METKPYKYIQLADQVKENGHRHLIRAIVHAANGRPGYAAGSARKARKNYQTSRAFSGTLWHKLGL